MIHAYERLIAHVANEIEQHPSIKACHKRIARSLADGRKGELAAPPAKPDARGLDIQVAIFNAFLGSLPDIKSLETLIRKLRVMRRSFEK